MVEIDRRKAALIAELEVSRGEIRRSLRACEENLDLVSVLRKNVRSNLKIWLPGAALGGGVVSRLVSLQLGRPREVRPVGEENGYRAGRQGGWIAAMFKLGLDLMRPTLLSMATEWLTRWASSFSGAGTAMESPAAEADRRAHARNGMF